MAAEVHHAVPRGWSPDKRASDQLSDAPAPWRSTKRVANAWLHRQVRHFVLNLRKRLDRRGFSLHRTIAGTTEGWLDSIGIQ